MNKQTDEWAQQICCYVCIFFKPGLHEFPGAYTRLQRQGSLCCMSWLRWWRTPRLVFHLHSTQRRLSELLLYACPCWSFPIASG